MELTKEILAELAKPFPANSISIKVQTKANEKGNALCVAYIDARDVMERLDSVVGGEWSDSYQKAPSGGLECALTVCGVTRRDVGDDENDTEAEKAGYSDAFKRAAVKFGIGRFLYSMPKMYAKVKTVGKYAYLEDGEEARLHKMIGDFLSGKPQQQKQYPAQSQTSEKTGMTLEQAMNTMSSDGTKYGTRTTEELSYIANNQNAPADKRMAAQLILKDRSQKGSK